MHYFDLWLMYHLNLRLLGFASSCVTETLCEWVMIDFHLSYLFILVCRDTNKSGFFKNICSKCRVGQLKNIGSTNQMKSWLVFVHRIQDR